VAEEQEQLKKIKPEMKLGATVRLKASLGLRPPVVGGSMGRRLPPVVAKNPKYGSGAFASDNHVLRASPAVVDIVAYVENFPPASLNIAF